MNDISQLLERFRRGAEVVATATTGVAGAQLDFVPQPGKWSIRQIVCHLADAELVGATRFRWVISEENPTLLAYNQEAWASRLNYSTRRISQALESFRRTRAENYELLRSLPEEAFSRTANHSEAGQMTLLDLLRVYAEHAEKHAQQMMNLRKLYKESTAASR